jgi:hypothetical protein
VGISKDVGRTCVNIFCVVLLFLLFIMFVCSHIFFINIINTVISAVIITYNNNM